MTHIPRTVKKIMVAMSGGVDSSVTAALLKKQGFEVSGVYMSLDQGSAAEPTERVKRIAAFLDIELDVVDLASEFQENVLEYFAKSYFSGKTPNPCVVCNRTIKFGKLLAHATSRGADMLATGHYARIVRDETGMAHLLKGEDPTKDQSYFLCRLTQEQLVKICFPLGETTKKQVYEEAVELGLKGMHSTESQDICFMQGTSLEGFLAAHRPRQEGDTAGVFVTATGEEKGRHAGIHNFTIGQRRGLGIPDATPFYVTGLDTENKRVIIGKDEDLWQNTLTVQDMNWSSGQEPHLPGDFTVKIRYRHNGASARVEREGANFLITFSESQRAITPGQFAVLYRDDEVMGGGEIL